MSDDPALDTVRRRIGQAAEAVARKWLEIRESNLDAAWDDFSFYKGNARWANGAAGELGHLEAPSARALCDAALEHLQRRRWDSDYDEPTAARQEMIAAIEAIRSALPPEG